MVNNNHLLEPNKVYFIHYIRGYIVIDGEHYNCEIDHTNLGIDLDGDTVTICNTDGLVTHYPFPKGFGKVKVLDKVDIVENLTKLAIECRSASKSSLTFNKINSVMNIPDTYEDGFVVSEEFANRIKETDYQRVEVTMNGLEHKLLGFYLKLDIRDNKVKLKCGNKLIPIKVNKRIKRRLKLNYFLRAKPLVQHLLSRKHYIDTTMIEENTPGNLFPFIYKLENTICKTLGVKKSKNVDFGTTLVLQNKLREKKQVILYNILKEVNMQINKTEVEDGAITHGVIGNGKSVFDIPELTNEQAKAMWNKIDKDILERSKGMLEKVNTEDLHPFLADRPGRIYILKSNTFKALFSTTYVKDLWKITPTVKDIIVSESCNVRISKNLYAVRIALVAWFYHLEGNGRNDNEVKLQEYVNFVRLARNEFYNVDFKINKRKFISGVKRSTTMAQYLEMIKV